MHAILRNRIVRVVSLVCGLSLLGYEVALACSPVPPLVQVECSNAANQIFVRSDNVHQKLTDIATVCNEDMTPAMDEFEQSIAEWINPKDRRLFLDGNLIFTPYSVAKEADMQKGRNDLLSCHYEDYKHVGGWLIIMETGRPYCGTLWYTAGSCPAVIFSLSSFLIYLVINPSLTDMPYLIGFAVLVVLVIGCWLYYFRRRSLPNRRRIAIESLGLVPLVLILVLFPLWLPLQIVGWFAGCYLVARWTDWRLRA